MLAVKVSSFCWISAITASQFLDKPRDASASVARSSVYEVSMLSIE